MGKGEGSGGWKNGLYGCFNNIDNCKYTQLLKKYLFMFWKDNEYGG